MAGTLTTPRMAAFISCALLWPSALALAVFKVPFTTDLRGVWTEGGTFGPDGPWQAAAIIPITMQEPEDPNAEAELPPMIPVWPGDFAISQLFTGQPGQYNVSSNATKPWRTFNNKDKNVMNDIDFYSQRKSTGSGITDGLTILNVRNELPLTARVNTTIYVSKDSEIVFKNGRKYSSEVGFLGLGRPGDKGYPGLSILQQMKSSGKILSSSFGLHLGSAQLQQPGSLILGGYEANRAVGPVGVFEMQTGTPIIFLLDVIIGVEGGSWPGKDLSRKDIGSVWPGKTANKYAENISGNFGGREGSVLVTVNPSVPGIYLPPSTCANAAKHLPVSLDESSGYYLWNTTSPDYTYFLENSGAYFAFVLADSRAENITVKVPFKLLNLTLDSPIMDKPTPYFPCHDTDSEESTYHWELGRAFLQAAFFGVNYDQNVTLIAQAPGPSLGQSVTEVIQPSDKTLKSQPAASFAASWQSQWKLAETEPVEVIPKASLSTGAIAGIAIGALAGVSLIAAGVWLYLRRRGKKQEPGLSELPHETANTATAVGSDVGDVKDAKEADVPNYGYGVHEMAEAGHSIAELASPATTIGNFAEAPGSPGVYEMPAEPSIPPPGWSPAR